MYRSYSLKKYIKNWMTMSFRYTKDNNRLTTEQRIFYEKNGYIVFPNFVPQNILDKCSKRFDDIVADRVSREGITVMYDVKDKKSINKLQDIAQDPVFREYIEYKEILDVIECFTGPNILAIHSMLIAKPPDIGYGSSRHPPHQDMYYFPLRPIDRIAAVWTAMETCDSTNGCLYVAPGTHRIGKVLNHNYPPSTEGPINKFYHGIQDLPNEMKNWVNLEMKVGDTVFFHPLLIHGSGVNKSKNSRRAISSHYAAAECTVVETNSAQEPIKKEILEFATKKFPGITLTYEDIWRFKSSLVRGLRSSF
ncbi:phytanoyl-CoA dioxygenase, peroxisomal [Linepithema humile]|uniref:phytanoyl-CoA dioxygenase, peroxisomal n=1 Tax=Linepithema humile TaxID=83485 RepID=UPI00351E28D7